MNTETRKVIRRLVVGSLLTAWISPGVGLAASPAPELPHSGTPRWQHLGPGGGSVLALIEDPSSPDVLYAATEFGVFRSTDRGVSWVGRGLGIGNDIVGRLVADPTHPGTVYAMSNAALYRTANSGALWVLLARASSYFSSNLALVPGQPATLFAGHECDVLRSTDGGHTFGTFVSFTGIGCFVQAVVPNPGNAGELFVATAAGVWRVSDTGGATLLVEDTDFNALAMAPSDPRTLYAVNFGEGWKTTDGGRTWSRFARADDFITGGYCLAVSPTAPTRVYLCDASGGVSMSTDGGDSWQQLTEGFPTEDGFTPQASAIVIDATTPEQVWAAISEYGVLSSSNGGDSWSVPLQSGLTGNRVQFLTLDSNDPNDLFAGFGPQPEVERSRDGGKNWSTLSDAPLGSTIVLNPTEPGTLYAINGSGIFRSQDGTTWSALLGGAFADLAFPLPGVIVAGGCGISRSVDGGRSWSLALACHRQHPLSSIGVEGFVADPSDSQTLYAEIARGQFGGASEIWRSSDAGATWARIDTGTSTVAVDPTHHGTLWAADGGAVSMTTDGGSHWKVIATIPGTSIATLIAASAPPLSLYAGTSGRGVFRSCDGGHSWRPVGRGLAGHLTISGLSVQTGVPNRLFARPQEGGLFEIVDDGCVTPDLLTP